MNVAVAGNMGSGKSTLIGVLSTGQYDNGKGSARTQVISMFINDDNDDDYHMIILVELLDTLFYYFLPFRPQHSSF